ncbi:MFS transporter [Clostridium bowmanii]|uniref:MFS transporter n=1 Tax=Clostridium bowmanii TaxID=132925 RepID=UPI001C0C4D36|nr:MFS transporter [Clostridium bowmanii]MBU3190998.1 MFS transporter [Clostridium bowmanii]MCA1075320.1 MFS transporter [Clostridium bowmanii]
MRRTNEFKASRQFFTVDSSCTTIIAVLASGILLSGYLEYLGIKESVNGIISSIPVMAAMAQPFGALAVERLKSEKWFVCTFALIHRLLFSLMYLIPLILPNNLRPIAVIIILISAHVIGAFMSPATTVWLMAIAPLKIRGRYFAIREKWLILTSSSAALIMGYIISYFAGKDKMITGYIILSITMFVATIIDFISLINVKETKKEYISSSFDLKDLLLPFKDKTFKKFMVVWCTWNIAIQISIPFLGIYQLTTLKLSYMYVMTLAVVVAILKIIVIKWWSKKAMKVTWEKVTQLAIVFIAVGQIMLVFTVEKNALWYTPIATLIGNIGWAAIGMSLMNFQYNCAPEKSKTIYLGVNALCGGLVGFCSAFLGAWIIEVTNILNVNFLGMIVKGQQVQMIFSGVILLCCALYIGRNFVTYE